MEFVALAWLKNMSKDPIFKRNQWLFSRKLVYVASKTCAGELASFMEVHTLTPRPAQPGPK